MKTDFDVAIVGSGFAGSLLAMVLGRLGRSVILLERGRHPRFAIGESTSPLANLILEQLAERYDLPRLLPLAAFGTWRRAYPDVVCGLKRGFTFFHHEAGRPYAVAPGRANQLLVAASPREEVADTHWLRADVDHFLQREAVACGAEYLDEVALDSATWTPDGAALLEGLRGGGRVAVRARLVVDASGPRGFLARALGLDDRGFDGYPETSALFSHFTDVARCDAMESYSTQGTPPYPIDDAAVHHVFDGGWMWILRFGNGVTSAGFAVNGSLAREIGLGEGEPAWRRLLDRFPTIREQFASAAPIRPFSFMPRLSYRAAAASGRGWLLLPSCAAFVDPLFSTGMPLALLGIERLGRLVDAHWGTEELDARLERLGNECLAEADLTAEYVGACLAAMRSFDVFAPLSMFYFAAASFAEMARRLGSPETPRRFLASDDERFARGLRVAASRARFGRAFEAPARFERSVACAVDRRNIAGLCDPGKGNWYGVDFEDVVRGAAKLGLGADGVRAWVAANGGAACS
jgi:tetracycline 7-halogenase / FADH2 O2-dependent halogenase